MGRCVRFLFRTLSIIVALIAVGIGYLKLNDESRKKGIFNNSVQLYF